MRLIAFVLLFSATVTALGSEFSLRTFCGRSDAGRSNRACVIGQIPKGTKVLLLGNEGSETCVSSVTERMSIENEALGQEIPISIIDPETCSDFRFSLTHSNPSLARSYRHISLGRVEDISITRKVNAAVRVKSSLIEATGGEHRTVLSNELPVLYGIPAKPDFYIAVFQNDLIPGDETHVLYARGVVSKIHGAARIILAFALADRIFVYYKFTCNIGCGYRGDFIVEITDEGAKVVFFDASWSA